MKKLLVVLLATVLLAGCAATYTAEQVRAQAASASILDLCRGVVLGRGVTPQIALDELSRRGVGDCAPYYGLISQQEQARSQALGQAASYFLRPPAPIAPLPAPVNCNSVRAGNTVQTSCW